MALISNVLVTGGTGFVGHWMHSTQPDGTFAVYQNKQEYQTVWEMGNWDAIVHLAPVSPNRVLKYAAKHPARVLFASSGAVYEQHTDYAFNKRLWEMMCKYSEADVVIARLFTFIGAHLKNLYAITNFIECARQGSPIIVTGNPKTVRTYLYGADLGRWMWKLLLEGDGIYDVGGEKPYTIAQIARLVADVVNTKVKIVNKDMPYSHYVPDVTRAHELGCVETVGLREAIERTINEHE